MFNTFKKDKVDTGEVGAAQFFGTAEDLKGDYLNRMAGAALGIYGNTAAEALYPSSTTDSAGQPLTGADKYTLRFSKDQLPPVNAFWSLTMYELPQSLLVANPINRYLINSPMLPSLVPDRDGGYTFYIQNESPGQDKEANWLPAPKGPFVLVLRLYWPKPEGAETRKGLAAAVLVLRANPGSRARAGAGSARTRRPARPRRSCPALRSCPPRRRRAVRGRRRIRRSPRPRRSSR